MSKQSRDVAAKNIQNTIRRVATDTSLNNKVEMSSSTKERSKQSSSSVEESVIINENVGRTANYNFFQVQNLYKTSLFLKDVKIVLKTGFELVEGTGIDDVCVFELEEFNNIYQKIDQTHISAVLSAMIAYKVLKQYTDLLDSEPKNNKFLKLSDAHWKNGDKENLKKLQNLFRALKPSRVMNIDKSELEKYLRELKKLNISFNEKVLISESFQTYDLFEQAAQKSNNKPADNSSDFNTKHNFFTKNASSKKDEIPYLDKGLKCEKALSFNPFTGGIIR